MSNFSIIDFLNKHQILWFPISLNIVMGDKPTITLNNIPNELYKSHSEKYNCDLFKPLPTDFKNLDVEIIKFYL